MGASRQKVGEGALGASADTAAKLIKLGESEIIGVVDEHCIGGADIDAGFNDGGAHRKTFISWATSLAFSSQVHPQALAMSNTNICFRN